MKDKEFLSRIFDYHNPTGVDPTRFEELRSAAKMMARTILSQGGHSNAQEIDKAIEHIRLALYYAIASIVLPP